MSEQIAQAFMVGYRGGVSDGTVTGAIIASAVILGTALVVAIIIRLVRK